MKVKKGKRSMCVNKIEPLLGIEDFFEIHHDNGNPRSCESEWKPFSRMSIFEKRLVNEFQEQCQTEKSSSSSSHQTGELRQEPANPLECFRNSLESLADNPEIMQLGEGLVSCLSATKQTRECYNTAFEHASQSIAGPKHNPPVLSTGGQNSLNPYNTDEEESAEVLLQRRDQLRLLNSALVKERDNANIEKNQCITALSEAVENTKALAEFMSAILGKKIGEYDFKNHFGTFIDIIKDVANKSEGEAPSFPPA